MMEEYQKKDLAPSKKNTDRPESVTIRAVSGIKNEYHFPGSGVWEAISVIATNIEEATAFWKIKRKPLQATEPPKAEEPRPTDTTTEQPKVEAPNETKSE